MSCYSSEFGKTCEQFFADNAHTLPPNAPPGFYDEWLLNCYLSNGCSWPPVYSSSALASSSSLGFAAFQSSFDVLSYVVIAACFIFSFLAGFSAGGR